MQFVVILMDLTLAHVDPGIQEMAKVVLVSSVLFHRKKKKFGNLAVLARAVGGRPTLEPYKVLPFSIAPLIWKLKVREDDSLT